MLQIHGDTVFVSKMYSSKCRVQATFNTGKSSQYYGKIETTFQNFESIFNLWPGFQPHSPTTATSACLWLMSFTRHFEPLSSQSPTVGSFGRPPLPLFYIWIRGLSFLALQAGNGQRCLCERVHRGTAQQSDFFFFYFASSGVDAKVGALLWNTGGLL